MDPLLADIKAIFGADADEWLDSANAQLGGKTPRDALKDPNSNEYRLLRELVDRIIHGMPT